MPKMFACVNIMITTDLVKDLIKYYVCVFK